MIGMSRLWKFVGGIDIGPDPNEEQTLPLLRHTELPRVQYFGLHSVSSRAEANYLVGIEMGKVLSNHTGNVFNDERLWLNKAQYAIKLPVQVIHTGTGITKTTYAKTLARIAANKKISLGKFSYLGNILNAIVRTFQIGFIKLFCIRQYIVGHNNGEAR